MRSTAASWAHPTKASVVFAELNKRPNLSRRIRELAGFLRGKSPTIADAAEIWHTIARQAEHYGRRGNVRAASFEEAVVAFMNDFEANHASAVAMLESAARREVISRNRDPYAAPAAAPRSLMPNRRKEP